MISCKHCRATFKKWETNKHRSFQKVLLKYGFHRDRSLGFRLKGEPSEIVYSRPSWKGDITLHFFDDKTVLWLHLGKPLPDYDWTFSYDGKSVKSLREHLSMLVKDRKKAKNVY